MFRLRAIPFLCEKDFAFVKHLRKCLKGGASLLTILQIWKAHSESFRDCKESCEIIRFRATQYRCRDPRSALWVEVRRIRPTRAMWAPSWDKRLSSRSASVQSAAGAQRAFHRAHLSCAQNYSGRGEPGRGLSSSRSADHIPIVPVRARTALLL